MGTRAFLELVRAELAPSARCVAGLLGLEPHNFRQRVPIRFAGRGRFGLLRLVFRGTAEFRRITAHGDPQHGHKKEKTKVMFRRMINRSVPSTWEFHTLMGVFDGAVKASTPEAHPKKRRETKS